MRKEIVPDAQGAYVEFENSGIGCVVEVECHFADATADVNANGARSPHCRVWHDFYSSEIVIPRLVGVIDF